MAGALRVALVVLVFLLVVAISTAAGQPAASDPATGLIVGQVVDAGTGRPISGALVGLAGGASPPAGRGAPPARPRPRMMTDAEGRFLLRGLAAGSYSLTAVKGGFVDGAYGRRHPAGNSQSLVLAAGEKVGDVTIRMWRFSTISGTVVDEAGEPVVGVELRALRRVPTGGRRRFTSGPATGRGSNITDDRGMYRISGLIPGDYVVVLVSIAGSVPQSAVQAYREAIRSGNSASSALIAPMIQAGASSAFPGSPSALDVGGNVLSMQRLPTPPPLAGKIFLYPTTYYPAAISAAQGTIVTVGSGEERSSIDFSIRPVPTSRVGGTVVGPDGPVANLPIALSVAGATDTVGDTDAVAGTVTDGTGAFLFPAVPMGQYTLRSVKPPASPSRGVSSVIQIGSSMAVGTVFSSGPEGPQPLPTEPTLSTSTPLAVGRNDISNLALVLHPGPRVSGRAEFDGTAARPQGDALAAIGISIEGETTRMLTVGFPGAASGSAAWSARFDNTGAFSTMSVPAGRYYVRVSSPPRGWTFKSATYNGRDVAEAPLELSGADVSGVVVTFTDQPAELSGVVTGASGSPDPDATVLLFPSDPQAWPAPPPGLRRFRAVRAAKDGAFKTTGIPAGSYYAVAVPDEHSSDWMDAKYLDQLSRLATEIRIEDGERKRQDLKTREVR